MSVLNDLSVDITIEHKPKPSESSLYENQFLPSDMKLKSKSKKESKRKINLREVFEIKLVVAKLFFLLPFPFYRFFLLNGHE